MRISEGILTGRRFLQKKTKEEDRKMIAADCTIPLDIGDEFVGPKTKGYQGSVATLALFGMQLAVEKGRISEECKNNLTDQLVKTADNIPDIAEKSWNWYRENKSELLDAKRIIVLGYGACMGAMLEGTLKLVEAVRYSVTGYEMEEFMHGIYHAIDQNTYLIYLGSKGKNYDRMKGLMRYFEEERNAHNFMITFDEKQENKKNLVYPFEDSEYFSSMEYVVPLQVLARKLSLDLGIDCNIPSDPDFHRKMGSYTY